ncbi:MAG: M48 family metallopeptidase [Candidatus Erginobacter occultus]|nr:M48 family metallopeptidase [Candidatus Erginobacter occultus]
MNPYLVIVLAVLFGKCLLDFLLETLNLRRFDPELPPEFRGVYDREKYRRARDYLGATTRLGLAGTATITVLTAAFILFGGFRRLDAIARSGAQGEIFRGLIFAGLFFLLVSLVNLPFSAYRTFGIEEKFGFNRTTPKTFILDLLKGWILAGLIGGAVLAAVIRIFSAAGPSGWLICWGAVSLFQLFILFIAPVTIMPLFNRFRPLEAGELKKRIEEYLRREGMAVRGVFTMDASRRSSKSNAFFTGFGRFRRIVLYDTLIENHSADEILAVIAHETAHYKLKHIPKNVAVSILATGLMFFILSRFITSRPLFAAFGVEELSVWAGIVFFAFLYAPIDLVISLLGNFLSRRFEYRADEFAGRTTGKPEAMIAALKKLAVDNLSPLTPHPLKVFFSYRHPPVLARIRRLGGN